MQAYFQYGESYDVTPLVKVDMTLYQKQEKKKRMRKMNYLTIQVQASDDQIYSLNDFKGQKIVLYFYPKDNTTACTLEAKSFSSLQTEFLEAGYRIIGVSRDSVRTHKNFINKQELNLLLLSDKEEELVKAFDVLKEKSMYGKTYIGIVRSTFILDENGIIIKEYRNVRAKGHAEQILDEIQKSA